MGAAPAAASSATATCRSRSSTSSRKWRARCAERRHRLSANRVPDAATGTRRLAYAGALTALAVGICYLEQIPWFELQSVVVFAAGYLLGARTGAVVGGLAMGLYSLANPYGLAHPVVLASQVIGRAFVG